MRNYLHLRSAVQDFLVDDCGGSLMEHALVAALLLVVGIMLLLALRKLTAVPA